MARPSVEPDAIVPSAFSGIESSPAVAAPDAAPLSLDQLPAGVLIYRGARLLHANRALLDWTGYEDALAYFWHRQLHIFLAPFYYIEYGVAQLGALQVWLQAARSNSGETVARYRSALALGGSRPLPQLFEAAGAQLAFDAKTMAPLAEALGEALARIPYA